MSSNIDVIGKKFNRWEVLQDLGNQKLLCRCDCGNVLVRNKYSIIHGKSKSCGCDKPDNTKIKLIPGTKYNKLTIIENIAGGKVLCRCDCGKLTKQPKTLVTSGRIKSCGCLQNDYIIKNTVGQRFGRLTVLKELGNGSIICKCDCGNIKEFDKYTVVTQQTTKSCGCLASDTKKAIKDNLVGQSFNDWVVLKELGNDKVLCRCSCGTEKVVVKSALKDGRSKSCGHNTNKFKDLTNKRFGHWVVLKELGHSCVQVRCDCGNIEVIQKGKLLNGDSKSCGCHRSKLMQSTLLQRYNETTANRAANPREAWQISTIKDRDKLAEFIASQYKDTKPTLKQLAIDLNISESYTGKLIHSYELDSYINYCVTRSLAEDEIVAFVKSILSSDDEIILNSKQIIYPKELDIYIPSKKVAIEFNGTYWHSSYMQPSNYHQLKSIECIKRGIRLIHIFEYEWRDDNKKEKLKNLLISVLANNNSITYARNTEVHDICSADATEFCNKYHLQGSAQSAINIGCYSGDELIGVMTFGVPRFDSNSDYELIRLCWKTGKAVVGGAEKMFKYFTDRYLNTKESIITYCDISKFDGNVYFRLGMQTDMKKLTAPGYVWVSQDQKEALSRYQTQKHKLVELGLGDIGRTEDEIMYKLGYYKVYNSGNLRFTYKK